MKRSYKTQMIRHDRRRKHTYFGQGQNINIFRKIVTASRFQISNITNNSNHEALQKNYVRDAEYAQLLVPMWKSLQKN